ncbi:helix-turn-helix domain-containing protein [Lactococcus raffinolactis]|uniref:helix-turn-helix domain-containing protein n=1 Tax=Pseudolactococcus raffinolactis TaxID=1366 RepID=UPI0034CE969F
MLKDRLKEARLNAKLTQKQIADMLQISQPYYAKWEKGERNPKPDSIKKLANILNVTSDYLQGRDDGLEDVIEVLKRKTLSEDEKREIVALLTKYLDK